MSELIITQLGVGFVPCAFSFNEGAATPVVVQDPLHIGVPNEDEVLEEPVVDLLVDMVGCIGCPNPNMARDAFLQCFPVCAYETHHMPILHQGSQMPKRRHGLGINIMASM